MGELITVVLPVYNGERYLEESINSIVQQGLQTWELIIVDDGSSDSSLKIANSFAERDKRIRVISNSEKIGLPSSLNRGFREASGDFLTWTSDDNRYLPDAFERLVEFLDANPGYKIVCANMYYVEEDDKVLKEYPRYDDKRIYISDSVGACFMYRREILDTVGDYDEDMIYVEDYDYWLRILKAYGSIGHLDQFLYVYRKHSGSLTSTKLDMIIKQHNRLMNRNINWIIANICDNEYLLLELYYRLYVPGDLSPEALGNIKKYIPEVLHDDCFEEGKPLILYGAGQMADKALQVIDSSQIVYFVDGDPNKVGEKKSGIRIISLKELAEIKDGYNVLITVSIKNLADVMSDLIRAGVEKFYSYYLFSLQQQMYAVIKSSGSEKKSSEKLLKIIGR